MPFHPPIPDQKQPGRIESGVHAWIEAEKLMQVALVLPSSALIGWFFGAWLDGKFHQHWIGMAGVVFGGLSGLVYVGRLAMEHIRQSELLDQADAQQEKDRQEQEGKPNS